MKNSGICKKDLEAIGKILNGYDNIFVYGSRVNGNYRRFSDLDLCFKKNLPEDKIQLLREKFENSDLAFKVEFTFYNNVDDEFKKRIDQECISLPEFLK